MYLLSKEEGGKGKPATNYMQAQMYLKTWDAPAYVMLPTGKDMVMPGEDAKIQFLLRKPMVITIFLILNPWLVLVILYKIKASFINEDYNLSAKVPCSLESSVRLFQISLYFLI